MATPAADQLTTRQLEILAYCASGYQYREAAEKALLSPHTVRHILAEVRSVYGVSTTTAAVALAVSYGVLELCSGGQFEPAQLQTQAA